MLLRVVMSILTVYKLNALQVVENFANKYKENYSFAIILCRLKLKKI